MPQSLRDVPQQHTRALHTAVLQPVDKRQPRMGGERGRGGDTDNFALTSYLHLEHTRYQVCIRRGGAVGVKRVHRYTPFQGDSLYIAV